MQKNFTTITVKFQSALAPPHSDKDADLWEVGPRKFPVGLTHPFLCAPEKMVSRPVAGGRRTLPRRSAIGRISCNSTSISTGDKFWRRHPALNHQTGYRRIVAKPLWNRAVNKSGNNPGPQPGGGFCGAALERRFSLAGIAGDLPSRRIARVAGSPTVSTAFASGIVLEAPLAPITHFNPPRCIRPVAARNSLLPSTKSRTYSGSEFLS